MKTTNQVKIMLNKGTDKQTWFIPEGECLTITCQIMNKTNYYPWKLKYSCTSTSLFHLVDVISQGHLQETENKRICQTSGLKTGHIRLRNLSSGCLWESSGNRI